MSDDDGAQLPELVVGPLLHDQGHRFPKRQGCDLARHREVARSLDGSVQGEEIEGFRVLQAQASSIPNAIAAVLLEIRDRTGCKPHIYFGWAEGNPLKYLARFVLFGEGDIAPVTREVLRRAEPDPKQRPAIHVG